MFGSDMLAYLESQHVDSIGLNSNELDLTEAIDPIEQAISGFE
jgi:hypothetical protein